ncbi:MAG: efflux RND transporter periplasmic adaptor subunit [Chloroflexi bacterium]|nr:efflux RND transporter periplasmic adaptor subunit [Chloroflexota bacterium]
MVVLTSCATQATPAVKTPATLVQVAPVQRTTIVATYSFTGSVVPLSSVNVQPRQGGRIITMSVSVGQTVHTGQVLAELDHTQQLLAVEQAKAALEQAQAKLDALKAGPRPEQVAQAKIAVEMAKSKLQAMLNPRPETIAQAQAQLTIAQQNVQALLTGRPQQVAQAKLALDQAKQRLATIQAGPRPEVVAQAQAQLTSAEAQLAALRNGPTAADLAPLQQAVEVAKNQLNAAQISRDATCGQVGKPAGFGTVGTQAACNAANAQVNAAQSAVNEAQAALAKAEQSPSSTDLQRAQAAVKAAEAALQQAEHPYTAQDFIQAQDAVSTAEQQLAIAEQPGSAEDIAKARAVVQENEAALALAQHPASAQDIQQAKLAVQNTEQQLALTEHPYTAQDVKQAQAVVDQARAAYDQAEQNLKDMTITAPISGVVTQKNFSRGALVSPSNTVLTIASPQDDIEINVPATEIAGVAVGTPALIAASESSPSTTVSGKVTSVAPSANAKSRAFLVKVMPSAKSVHLPPGTFATVSLTPLKHTNVLAVPNDAIVQRQGKAVIFIVENGLAMQTAIQTGISNGTVTEVMSGLKVGQEVITQGQDTLVNGDHVTVAAAAG